MVIYIQIFLVALFTTDTTKMQKQLNKKEGRNDNTTITII